ncbi:MAG: hypothetical protein JWQ96_3057, partial [Segetibacter sp.]|nr:hypothetical protein [Segetibacter sp.]
MAVHRPPPPFVVATIYAVQVSDT